MCLCFVLCVCVCVCVCVFVMQAAMPLFTEKTGDEHGIKEKADVDISL